MMLDTVDKPTLKIVRTGGALGARIEGLDLSKPITPQTMATLRGALSDHGYLSFPKQALTPAELSAFSALWGEMHITPTRHLEGYPGIIQLGGMGKRPYTDHWHTDQSADERPPMATILQAQ